MSESPRFRSARSLAARSLGYLVLIAAAVAVPIGAGAPCARSSTPRARVPRRQGRQRRDRPPRRRDADGIYRQSADDGTGVRQQRRPRPPPMMVGQVFPGFARRCARCRKAANTGRHAGRLAYGATPPPQALPPNADLYFDVHVLKVVRGADCGEQQQQIQQQQQQQPPPEPARLRPALSLFAARFSQPASGRPPGHSTRITLSVATIGSANSSPISPNNTPNSNCAASTSAGARSTVRRAT